MMMPPFPYLQCMLSTIILFLLVLFLNLKQRRNELFWSLPFLGILPEVLLNLHLFHDKVTEVLKKSKGTFQIKTWLPQEDILFTSDPVNVQHVMTTNFSKYPKGTKWRTRFDVFGDYGLFNSDLEIWKHQIRIVRNYLSHKKVQQLTAKIIPEIIDKGLIPVLEHVYKQDITVDLQDLLTRYTYDFICIIATGLNPNSLSIGFPEIPFVEAIDDVCEAIMVRYIMPPSLWKLQRWLGLGKERKFIKASKAIDRFSAKHISIKREELRKDAKTKEEEENFNVLKLYLSGHEIGGPTLTDERVVKDNLVGIIFAGEETTSIALSWFFWLISKNPFAEMNIREEIRRNLPQNEVINKGRLFELDELSKLVYLHAAFCETLRLFPPVPYENRTSVEPDILPSGHKVNEKTTLFISAYAMGRMSSVWGEDCHEFKPERWITEDGGIKHEPPHKFFAFSARPRNCPGKEIAFILMKIIAATIIHNYDIEVLGTPPVIPTLSISLRMKHGLMARVKGRSAY